MSGYTPLCGALVFSPPSRLLVLSFSLSEDNPSPTDWAQKDLIEAEGGCTPPRFPTWRESSLHPLAPRKRRGDWVSRDQGGPPDVK